MGWLKGCALSHLTRFLTRYSLVLYLPTYHHSPVSHGVMISLPISMARDWLRMLRLRILGISSKRLGGE